MDFSFSEEQTMVRDLARGILEKEVSVERLKSIEQSDEWHDARLWSTLADAGLLGIAVPESFGGMGLGLLELLVLLEEIGRVVAPVPALPALVLGGLTIAQFGTEAQKKRWLHALAKGDSILTAALTDAGASASTGSASGRGNGSMRARGGLSTAMATGPATASRDGRAWRLRGGKTLVPAARIAGCMLVPAATDDGPAIFLVDPTAAGVTLTARATSRGERLFDVIFSGATLTADDLLGEQVYPDTRVLDWMRERATLGVCATQVGVSERALEMTATYVRERVQFGVPIGSFQAVQHRAADAYIDVTAMRWVAWRAAWKLAQGLPASNDVAVAKFWAAEGGARVAASAQHLHAGIGVDVDYPIHRYFLWSKALELGFGSAHAQLAKLGRDMACNPPFRESAA